MSFMAVPLAIAGAAMGVVGNLSAANAAKATGQQNAAMAMASGQAQQQQAEYNAQLAEREGAAARDAAGMEEAQRRERARFLMADNRQRALRSGIDLEGSPLEVLAFNAGQYELDALAARYSGEVRGQAADSEAVARRYGGAVSMASARQGAGSALLAGQTAATAFRFRAAQSGATAIGSMASAGMGMPGGGTPTTPAFRTGSTGRLAGPV